MKLRTLFMTSLLAVFALSASGCGNPSDEEIEAELDAIFEEAFEEAFEAEAELPENANTAGELGISFDAEGFSNTVNSYLDNWANPEDVFGFETADEGNKFVALNLTVTNNGSEEDEASSLYYTLAFGGEENAEHSYYGTTAPNITHFDSSDLAPGDSYTGDFLFEVPADSTPADWTLVYNSDPFDFKDGYAPTEAMLMEQ
jgi:hypothetical protein